MERFCSEEAVVSSLAVEREREQVVCIIARDLFLFRETLLGRSKSPNITLELLDVRTYNTTVWCIAAERQTIAQLARARESNDWMCIYGSPGEEDCRKIALFHKLQT